MEIMIVLSLLIFTIILIRDIYKTRCPSCRAFFASKYLGCDILSIQTKYRNKKIEDVTRDGSGKIIQKIEKNIQEPYEVYECKHNYLCKKCKHSWNKTTTGESKNNPDKSIIRTIVELSIIFGIIIIIAAWLISINNQKNNKDTVDSSEKHVLTNDSGLNKSNFNALKSQISDAEYKELKNLSSEYANIENKLEEVYQLKLKSLDEQEQKLLRKNQRAWIKERDRKAFEHATKGSEEYISYLIQLTKDRLIEIESFQAEGM